MLYTRKGDNGTTKLFNCPQGHRLSKADTVFDVLGTLDELNSSLGYAKSLARKSKDFLVVEIEKVPYENILDKFQQSLFSIQAKVGGADIKLEKERVLYLEKIIYEAETLLPPITSFVVSSGGETGSYLDVSRTIARRAERQLIKFLYKNKMEIEDTGVTFLNRLGSALYALARFANYQEGYLEHPPNYI